MNKLRATRNAIWMSVVVLALLTARLWPQALPSGMRAPVGMLLPSPSPQGGGTLYTGVGLTGLGTSASPLTVDATAVPTRLSATATVTFASIPQSACHEQTITLTGAVTGDEVMLGPPATVEQGFMWSGYVSSANTVTVRMCKITAGTAAPAARSWRATILRSF